MSHSLQSLVTITITAQMEVEITEEGVRAKLPSEPWVSNDLTLRLADPQAPTVTLDIEVVKKAKELMVWTVLNRAARNAPSPGDVTTEELPGTVKGSVN